MSSDSLRSGNWFPVESPRTTRSELNSGLAIPVELLLASLDIDPGEDIVLACGSLVEGFGNVGSDLDLLVVAGERSRQKRVVWFSQDLGRWVDVEVFRPHDVERVRSQATRASRAVVDWASLPRMTIPDIDLLHDLCNGVPIAYSAQPVYDIDKQNLSLIWAISNIVAARARWLDAMGAYLSGVYGQSWYAAKLVAEFAMDAISSLHGETNPNQKWRWAKLARLVHSSRLPPSYIDDFTSRFDSVDQSACAKKQLVRAADLLATAMHQFITGQYKFVEINDQCFPARIEYVSDRTLLIEERGNVSEYSGPLG